MKPRTFPQQAHTVADLTRLPVDSGSGWYRNEGIVMIGSCAANEVALAHQCITKPPSTLIVCPVTLWAHGEARNTAIAATSSGVCQRPRGTTRRTFSPAQSSYDLRCSWGCCLAPASQTARL